MENIVDHVDKFGFTMCDATSDEIITDQKGAFRANCLDWSVVSPPSFAFIEQFKQVLTALTLFRTFYRDWLWSNICFLFDVNGYTQTHSGLIIVNYGPKMATPYLESTLGQAPWIPALQEVASGRWLVGITRIYIAWFSNSSFSGVLSDATKSVSRAYINNFQDKAKQNAIDTFLVGLDQDRAVETPDVI